MKILLFFLFCSTLVFSQEPAFKHFDAEDGLPGSEVYCVKQDRKGFIWFATDHGVSRFDGTQFKTYTINEGLPDNTVFEIIEDYKGRLWFQSFSGELSFYHNDRIYTISNNELIRKTTGGNVYNFTFVSVDDIFWLGVGNTIFQFRLNKDLSCSLIGALNNCNLIDLPGKENVVEGFSNFVGDAGPLRFRIGDHTVMCSPEEIGITTKTFGVCGTRLQDSTLLVTAANALLQANEKGILNIRLFKNRILRLYQLNGEIWIAKYKGGITRFKIDELFTGKEGQTYFPDLSVSSFLEDDQQGKWITTLERGVYYIPSEACFFFPQFDKLPDRKIFLLSGDRSAIYTGLMDGSLWKLSEGKLTALYIPSGEKGPGNSPRTVFRRKNGEVWFSFNDQLISVKEGKINLLRESPPIISFAEAGENIWAASNVSLYKMQDRKFLQEYGFKNVPLKIHNICYNNNTLWLATISGLWSFKEGQLHFEDDRHRYLQERLVDIESDHEGNLIMASRAYGLLIQFPDTLVQIPQKKGLLSDICNNMLVDEEQNIWVATNKGLSQVYDWKRDGSCRIRNYTIDNGLVSNEVTSVYRQGDQVFVATINGLSMIDLRKVKKQHDLPPVYITSIAVNGMDTVLTGQYDLPYDRNNIRISFAGLSYASGGKLSYRYILASNNDQNEQIAYTGKNDLQLTAMPPGRYTFRIWAKNADDQWSLKPALLTFTIHPPFWGTWWFQAMCIIAMGTLVISIVRWRFKQQLDRSHLRNELAEVKQQALSARMNPHFMFNALNSIQNYISLSQIDDAHRYLASFSRLMRLILQNSRNTFVLFSAEVEALKIYVELEMLRFEERLSSRISIDPALMERDCKVPSMLIQPYVENAIKHGLLPKEGKGELDIDFRMERQDIRCTIRDNGIGRSRARAYSQSRQRHLGHESMGADLTENRIKLLRSIFKRKIHVEVTDLFSEGRPSGTLVTLIFPALPLQENKQPFIQQKEVMR